jgi:hypothetical protein
MTLNVDRLPARGDEPPSGLCSPALASEEKGRGISAPALAMTTSRRPRRLVNWAPRWK